MPKRSHESILFFHTVLLFMDDLRALAEQFRIPLPAAQRLAAAVAERCALVANRFEPAGDLVDLGIVEAIGAEIGAAILAEFPEPEPSAAVDPSRLGIGGPRRP